MTLLTKSLPDRRESINENRHEKNFFVVAAAEEYTRRHGIFASETLELFLRFGVTETIRQCYETLHTQSIYREKGLGSRAI